MAKPKIKRNNNDSASSTPLRSYLHPKFVTEALFDVNYTGITTWFLLAVEVFLNLFIINRVNYTEIDWIAYMQEVEGFLNGTLDYYKLQGDTGPLVYPAGFVYVYSIFYYLTSYGANIKLAQYIFLVVYMLQLYLIYRIHRKTLKIPPYALIITCLTSYRIHSIYVLRLFNDPVAVLLFYVALNAWIDNRWIAGSLAYSLAVSVKMNVLLYAPCLLVAYLTNLSLKETFMNMFLCGLVQLVVGLPFLLGNPVAYVARSFDLGRVFEHQWTVNYRFLSREVFENRAFHAGLLGLHVLLLLAFLPFIKRYLSSYATINQVTSDVKKHLSQARRTKKSQEVQTRQLDFASKQAQLFVLPFFVTNLIGVACARSLHYQFYSWYFHSLLYLGFCTEYKKPVVFLLLGVIEMCWNTYPSTNLSSAALHVCHAVLLIGLFKYMRK